MFCVNQSFLKFYLFSVCEQTYLNMNFNENKPRNELNDVSSDTQLKSKITNYSLDLNKHCSEIQVRKSRLLGLLITQYSVIDFCTMIQFFDFNLLIVKHCSLLKIMAQQLFEKMVLFYEKISNPLGQYHSNFLFFSFITYYFFFINIYLRNCTGFNKLS